MANALSRVHENIPESEVRDIPELEDIAEFPVWLRLSENPMLAILHHSANSLVLRDKNDCFLVDIKTEQRKDPDLAVIISFKESGVAPIKLNSKQLIQFRDQTAPFFLGKDGILYFNPIPDPIPATSARLVVPKSLRSLVFDSFHNSPLSGGHFSARKTLSKCKKYYWDGMNRDILFWTKSCHTCQLKNSPLPAYKLPMLSAPSDTLFTRIAIDLCGEYPISEAGNKHIMNVICLFSKYVISVPVPDARSVTLAEALLKNVYLIFGGCVEILTDNAKYFSSDFFKELCSLLYINKTFAVPYYSKGNGAVERTFRTFNNILSKYVDDNKPHFDQFLQFACFCYNTSIHESTGETPFFLVFGRDPIFAVDQILDPRVQIATPNNDVGEFKSKLVTSLRSAWKAANQESELAQARTKGQYDKKMRDLPLKVGDRVFLRNYVHTVGKFKKLFFPWKGTFRIIQIDQPYALITSCSSPNTTPKRVHINQLKPCFEITGPASTSKDPFPEEEMAGVKLKSNKPNR